MVGIVIVSHSESLAEGIKELALQMTRGKVPIEVAGGIDDPANPIGTDPMKVLAAIEAVHAAADSGVLVLMDLGSALMSAETALDFLPDKVRASVRLCAAPVVEGALAAAIQASAGASLDAVASEALAALAAKKEQLAPLTGVSLSAPAAAATEPIDADAAETRIVIRNRFGLHARPAANFVTTATRFNSAITVYKGPKAANGKSINQMAKLAARKDDEIRVRAVGPDAKDAITAIKALGADSFGDKDDEVSKPPQLNVPAPNNMQKKLVCGEPASAGLALGPAHVYRRALPKIEVRNVVDPEAEITRLAAALSAARDELAALAAKAKKDTVRDRATIFDVHRLLLEDPDLVEQTKEEIRQDRISAEAAWSKLIEITAETYRSLENTYMQCRAADVLDAGSRVLRRLAGESRAPLLLETPGIIVAHDLLPSEVARLDPENVVGIVTETGGSTSHAAIIARSLGIPAVVGAGPAVAAVVDGTVIALDGDTGRIWLSPDEEIREEIGIQRSRLLEKKRRVRQERHMPAVTLDGVSIHVTANIGYPRDALQAFDHGAEGVGLFRTEFLFQQRDTAPSEDEQYAAYIDAARAMKGRPVTIRTLDAGADKPLSYLTVPGEDNPFLGERGIRLCLAYADMFKPQLRALLRAAREENIRIMFPMVAHLAELRSARALLEEARQELAKEGSACDKSVKTGIMIEVPAAVAMADQLAKEADFFSIGTNDLTQYVMAADRGNAAVSHLSDSFHPAVLRMVRTTVEAAHKAGIPVGVCGELAAGADAAAILIGLGLDELSMNADKVPEAKAAIRKLDAAKCREIAVKALDQIDGDGVRQLLMDFKCGAAESK